MAQETIERTFAVQAPARLRLGNVRGSVVLGPGTAGQIQVTAVKRAGLGSEEHTQVEISQAEDGTVVVETRLHKESMAGLFGRSQPCSVDYTVSLPSDSHVNIRCVSSDMRLEDLSGEFDLESVSGEIALARLTGPLRLSVVSGDVSGEQVAGTLKLKAVSGRVELRQSNLPSVSASTVSGNVHLETPLGEGPYRFDSVSGGVHLHLPAEARCSAHLNTVSGRLHSALPITASHRSRGNQKMDVQGGGAEISLHSVSGNLWLETPGGIASASEAAESFVPPIPPMPPIPPIPPMPPMPPMPPIPSPEGLTRSQVLEQVSRGEMSVDEAVRLLKDL